MLKPPELFFIFKFTPKIPEFTTLKLMEKLCILGFFTTVDLLDERVFIPFIKSLFLIL